jgi:hypothetical protein
LFKVSPVTPQLYWRIWSADYYTGRNWIRTTDEKAREDFPQIQDDNATRVFTVEVNSSQREVFLPVASANSTLADISLPPTKEFSFYTDALGNAFKVIDHRQQNDEPLIYEVSWCDVEVDDRLISLNNITKDILNTYLQLSNVPIEVWKLAKDLEDPSYSVLDQILADVQFLRTNFVYDTEWSQNLYERIILGSDISSYLEQRRGICIDAATALAVILRIQNIPSRISIGYNSERTEGGKRLYYTTGGHSVTEVYLPPYGWIQFDATPPLEERPLVKVIPFKKESSIGSKLFYQLSITNRRNSTDNFKLFVDSKRKWNIEAAPEKIMLGALQTADALLKVNIPDNASFGEKDFATVTVVSLSNLEVAFSIRVITQVENVTYIKTVTTLGKEDKTVIRGDTFWVNGTVLTASDEQVDNMTIFVFLTKNREAKGAIIGKGHSRQGNFHIESTVPSSAEIGDHKVIPISLGTTHYAPSSTDCRLKVRATTRIELSSEEDFLLGYGAIHGKLFWDNRTGFANAPLSLQIASLAYPLDVWKLQNLTFDDGSFRIETRFENPGVYEVEAVFSGNEDILGSDVTKTVKLKRGQPTIHIFSEDVVIRGEVLNFTGVIQFENTGIWGEPVTVAFDNRLITTTETKDNGSYTWSFPVDSNERLGFHIVTVALKKSNVSEFHEIKVKSKTTLTTKVSVEASGMLLLFSVSLSDDHDLPIQGAEIIIDNYGLSWKTDSNGNVAFLLDHVKLWPENLALQARFDGSEFHLPVATTKEVLLEPVINIPFLLPLILPTLVIMAYVYGKHLVERRRALQQTIEMDVVRERAIAMSDFTHKLQAEQPLKIVLLDIQKGFPNVWGVKDRLRVEIALEKSVLEKTKMKEVEVLIDGEIIAFARLSQQGGARLSHVFINKGEHKVRATLLKPSGDQPWNAEVDVRVVDYLEEIISLYNGFLRNLTGYGIITRNEMTAREIESLIMNKGGFDPEAVRKVTNCFEKAEYSNHMATRKDYESMYLSLKELTSNVK